MGRLGFANADDQPACELPAARASASSSVRDRINSESSPSKLTTWEPNLRDIARFAFTELLHLKICECAARKMFLRCDSEHSATQGSARELRAGKCRWDRCHGVLHDDEVMSEQTVLDRSYPLGNRTVF